MGVRKRVVSKKPLNIFDGLASLERRVEPKVIDRKVLYFLAVAYPEFDLGWANCCI